MSGERSESMSGAAEGTRTVVVERVFAHSPEKVWWALTDSPLLAQWLMKNDFAPEVGRRFQFRAEPVPQWDGLIECEVRVVEPLKRLAYSWGTMGIGLEVLWTLSAVEGGTHLRMEQTGFGPEMEANYKGAMYGWKRFFDGLDRVLDGGAV